MVRFLRRAMRYERAAIAYQNEADQLRRGHRLSFVGDHITVETMLDRAWCCWSAAIADGLIV